MLEDRYKLGPEYRRHGMNS